MRKLIICGFIFSLFFSGCRSEREEQAYNAIYDQEINSGKFNQKESNCIANIMVNEFLSEEGIFLFSLKYKHANGITITQKEIEFANSLGSSVAVEVTLMKIFDIAERKCVKESI